MIIRRIIMIMITMIITIRTIPIIIRTITTMIKTLMIIIIREHIYLDVSILMFMVTTWSKSKLPT